MSGKWEVSATAWLTCKTELLTTDSESISAEISVHVKKSIDLMLDMINQSKEEM